MSDSQEISAQVEEPVKRKRGRPKKIALDPSEQKRSRGRPKGSKNKNPPKVKIIDNKPKRPRGRPRKTVSKLYGQNPEEKETVHPVQSKDSAEDKTTD